MDLLLWAVIIGVIVGIIGGVLQVLVSRNQDNKKKQASESLIAAQGMKVTKKLGDLIIDDVNKKWTIKGYPLIYNYSDIVDISETQNGTKTKISGGLVGGVTHRGLGIGVSSGRSVKTTISSWTIDITVRNAQYPLAQIVLLSGATISVGDFTYNAVNLLREQYIAQLKQMQDAGQRMACGYAQPVSPQLNITANIRITSNVSIAANSPVYLQRDYSNQYAMSLIVAYINGQMIGYVDQRAAQTVAPIMDSGVHVYARALSVSSGNCAVQIYTS